MCIYWQYKIILHFNLIINYFKIIILKVNKLITHNKLWLNDYIKLFILSIHNLLSLILKINKFNKKSRL